MKILHEYLSEEDIKNENFYSKINEYKNEYKFSILFDIIGKDNSKIKDEKKSAHLFEIIYILYRLSDQSYLFVHLNFADEKIRIPSLEGIWGNALLLERECFDLMGIKFLNQEDPLAGNIFPLRLFSHPFFDAYPLRKDFIPVDFKKESFLKKEPWEYKDFRPDIKSSNSSDNEFNIKTIHEYGPSDSLTKGRFRMRLTCLEHKIVDSQFQLGFRHAGVEKICEEKSYDKISHYLEGLNPRSPFFNSLLWLMLFEKAMEIPIPDKAMALRIVEMEMGRIYDHLHVLLDQIIAVDAFFLSSSLIQEIKRIRAWKELVGEHPSHHLNLKLGGFKKDYSKDQLTATLQLVQILERKIHQISSELTRSSLWLDHQMLGVLSASQCLNLGITGPTLRASGINYDLRKSRPYYFYKDLEFEIPIGHCGSSYDRYLVLMEEMRQSLKIVSQILDNLPTGDVGNKESSFTWNDMKISGEHFISLEAAQGELAYYLFADEENNRPYRLKIRSPHFSLVTGLQKVLLSHEIHQVPMILASLNPVWEEFER